jgi:myo-inositol-1-phosphate synthase
LSIITNPKQSRGNYANWEGDTKPPSNREKLEQMIDAALENCKDYDAFIAAMIAAGCEVKRGKNLAFKIPGAERFARCKSLGADYTEEAIIERLSDNRFVALKSKTTVIETFVPFVITGQTKFGLLIDIEQKIQEGKGEGYENWARIYNLKQAAKTLLYLNENGIDSYDDLVKKSAAASSDFNGRLNRIKEIETRQKEITELQKHMGTYGKTLDVYKEYLNAKNQNKFFEEHRADITLHQAAKKYFDEHGYSKGNKLPSMQSLKQEWAELNSEKKTLYNGYHELKEHGMKLLMAKDNAERLLNIKPNAPEHTAEHKQNSHER